VDYKKRKEDRGMNYLTSSEDWKITEIKGRLGRIASPVLRLQAILQFSQIVDILDIGDTAKQQLLQPCTGEDEEICQDMEEQEQAIGEEDSGEESSSE
jgi:hypothetical protein